jgi:hypothetical protein
MNCRILINYRREDSLGSAGRLYDRLVNHFSREQVFMDVDAIDPGIDFVEAIKRAVATCDVFLAIIGPDWVTAKDNEGRRRLDKTDDFVRIEIAAALDRNIRVIPVLVKNAEIPRSTDLPKELKSLVRRNYIEISHTRFDLDAERLIRVIERAFEQEEIKRRKVEKAEQEVAEHTTQERCQRKTEEKSLGELGDKKDKRAEENIVVGKTTPKTKKSEAEEEKNETKSEPISKPKALPESLNSLKPVSLPLENRLSSKPKNLPK